MASKKQENLERQIREQEELEKQMAAMEAAMGGDTQSVVDTQVGLPPYWKPMPDGTGSAVGRWFCGVPMSLDNQDPNFPRWVIQATQPLTCYRGPKADMEEVQVQPGDLFTISEYAGLNLREYFGMKIGVVIVSDTPLSPTPDGEPRNFYRWQVRLDKNEAKELQEFRKETAKMLREEARMASILAMQQRRKQIEEQRAKLLSARTATNGEQTTSQSSDA